MKRQRLSRVEAFRMTLATLIAAVALALRFVQRFPLKNVALVIVALMLMALAYCIYRIVEDRKKGQP